MGALGRFEGLVELLAGWVMSGCRCSGAVLESTGKQTEPHGRINDHYGKRCVCVCESDFVFRGLEKKEKSKSIRRQMHIPRVGKVK